LRDITFTDVGYAPGFSLFSLTKATSNGWILEGSDKNYTLRKGEHTIVFDIPVMTPKGMVWCVYAPPKRPELLNGMKDEEAQTPEEEVKPSKVVPYHVAHAQLGHCGEDATRAVAAHLDWKIARGTASPCISCAEVKVKKKTFKQEGATVPTNLKRSTDDSVNPIGTRWYLDQASAKKSLKDLC
jgi:hypothetical protein